MKISLFACSLMILAAQSQAFAQEDSAGASREIFPKPKEVTSISEAKPHVGVTAGLAGPTGSYTGVGEFGLNTGVQVFIPISIGLDLARSRTTRGSNEELTRTKLLTRGAYNFGGPNAFLGHSYVGGLFGLVSDESNVDNTAILTGIGAMAGFDYPVSEFTEVGSMLTLGGELSYLHVTGNHPGAAGLNAQMKYWF